MARGPFQGTFQPNARPTVATAPDAVVHINGEAEVAGCPQCSRRFDLNKYITSIQTDLNVDSVPGSANISLSIPRHAIDDFYFDGNPVITTMMEVEIYAKGNFLVEGFPQYYPIFWGLVTEVQDNYSSGEHTVSIHCADILKWWELCKTNINPAALGQPGDQGRNLWGNVFASKNAYDIIFTLATQSFGDVLIGTGSIQNFLRDTAETNTAMTDMTLYWEKRFSKMRSNLMLYGTSGVAVRGDTLFQGYSKNPSENQYIASTTIRDANGTDGGQMFFDPSGESTVAMKTDPNQAGPGGLVQAEYQTKLEIANAAKESVGFEFYMDVTGDIVFKPPFYNLDVLGNKPLSWIQDIDVIDWDFSESESEVVTQLVMQGEFHSQWAVPLPPEVQPQATVTDYHLLRKYGWRTQSYNAEFLVNPRVMFYHGLDVLDRINAKRHRGNVTIPMRSELRLGFPIYLAPKDEIWYVSGISHSLSFGGRATTTLQLTSRRSKFIAPKGIGTLTLKTFGGVAVPESTNDGGPRSFRYSSRQLQKSAVFELKRDGALEVPGTEATAASPLILRHPKTGRIVGYPNVTMVYSRPFSDSDVQQVVGQQTNDEAITRLPKEAQAVAAANRAKYDADQQKQLTAGADSIVKGKYLHNAYQYGMNAAGVFIYAHDVSGVIREALAMDTANITPVVDLGLQQANPQTFIRPVSDERGFEVIGHNQYGRRVSLRDGRLIINDPNKKVKIDLQLALAGDLSSMLAAQSQGLTSIITGYADPASELAEMTPEDGQTAAAAFPGAENNPSKKSIVFTNVGDEFVDDAPLGSPEQKGVKTVEATQLSRALSLAEMHILDGTMVAEPDCACITGRADLAFMASDYQVQTLSGSFSDLTALPVKSDSASSGGPIQVTTSSQLQDRVDALDSAVSAAKERANEPIVALEASIASARKQAKYLEDQSQQFGVDPEEQERLREEQKEVIATLRKLEIQLQAEQSGVPSSKIPGLEAAIADAKKQAKYLEDQSQQFGIEPEEQEKLRGEVNEVAAKLRSLEKQLEFEKQSGPSLALEANETVRKLEVQRDAAKADAADQGLQRSSSASIFTQSNSEVVSKVETFLVNLYKTLDAAHLQFEKTIRGDFMPQTNAPFTILHEPGESVLTQDAGNRNVSFKDLHQPGRSVARQREGNPNGPDLAPVSEFAPPFSAPERFRLGDPNAAIGAIDSSRDDLSKAWSGFSQKLQANARTRALSMQVSQDRASIARLTASRDQLIKQRDSATVVIGGDVQKQIDQMTTQISKLEQKVAENQAKLSEAK